MSSRMISPERNSEFNQSPLDRLAGCGTTGALNRFVWKRFLKNDIVVVSDDDAIVDGDGLHDGDEFEVVGSAPTNDVADIT